MKQKAQTEVESLCKLASDRFPDIDIEVDPPRAATGLWVLDLELDGHYVAVQWQQAHAFGLSCREDLDYGEGPDERYPDSEAAFARILSLLLSKGHTRPRCVDLAELRREQGVSQVELAEATDSHQAAISKLERRSDMRLSSLRAHVEGLGASLAVTARFPDGTERELAFTDSRKAD